MQGCSKHARIRGPKSSARPGRLSGGKSRRKEQVGLTSCVWILKNEVEVLKRAYFESWASATPLMIRSEAVCGSSSNPDVRLPARRPDRHVAVPSSYVGEIIIAATPTVDLPRSYKSA